MSENFTFTTTFRKPWWEQITVEEWAAMSEQERRHTLMAIPPRIAVFDPEDPNTHVIFESDVHDPTGRLDKLQQGDYVSITYTLKTT